jgi:hypothetical protein
VATVAALKSGEAREGLHLVVKANQQSVEVTVVERLKGAAGQLHVLLGHADQYPAATARA